MNIIDVLNIEHHVIINMLMHVSRRYIASFCTTCLKTYAMKDTVLKYKDRATKGFPRREGKYKRHKISKDVIELKNPYSRTQSTGHSLTACMSIVMQQQLSDDLVKVRVQQWIAQAGKSQHGIGGFSKLVDDSQGEFQRDRPTFDLAKVMLREDPGADSMWTELEGQVFREVVIPRREAASGELLHAFQRA